jgi:hypothetical protein
MHSVKNRFLMRIKNTTGGLFRSFWAPMILRDLLVIGGAVFTEPASLMAFGRLVKCLPRALRARRAIMDRRRIDDAALAAWFSFEPVAMSMGASSEAPAAVSEPAPAVQWVRSAAR